MVSRYVSGRDSLVCLIGTVTVFTRRLRNTRGTPQGRGNPIIFEYVHSRSFISV
jgi:hypothetical protein